MVEQDWKASWMQIVLFTEKLSPAAKRASAERVRGVYVCVYVCTWVCMRGRIYCCHSQRICIERACETHASHQGSLTSFLRHAESLMGVHRPHTICRIMMSAPYTNQGGNRVWLCTKSHSSRLNVWHVLRSSCQEVFSRVTVWKEVRTG